MHRQVAERLRSQILTGAFAPGVVLPSIHRLAAQFGTSYFTVQTALTALDAEGFVESRRRVGTIVRHNAAVLTCAGLYCGGGMLDSHEFDFSRAIMQQIQTQLAAINVRTEIFLDSRPDEARAQPMPALARAVAEAEIQAVIVPRCDNRCLPWLSLLPVTSSFMTSDKRPNRVRYNPRDMLRLGLGSLLARGCRSVGLISCIAKSHVHDTMPEDYTQFYPGFAEVAAELGLRVRDAWILAPENDDRPVEKEREGYDNFHALWRQAHHPEGLLVYPDVTARGVMTAALELGVQVPADVKMVFHRNTEVDWTCPLAVDWVESDTAAWAGALIDQIRRQKAGADEAAAEVVLPYRLVLAESKKLRSRKQTKTAKGEAR